MCLLLTTTCPKTQGLDHRIDLTDPHTITLNAAKVLSRNRVTMVVGEEATDVEAMAASILPTGESMKMIGPTMT